MSREKLVTEHRIQCDFIRWVRTFHPTTLFCATVGGKSCHLIENVKAKAEGYNKGIPDLFFYEPSKDRKFVGLALELKTASGVLRPEQVTWLRRLDEKGWKTAVPRSVEECKAEFNQYFGHKVLKSETSKPKK